MRQASVTVVGAGPAGGCAALAALSEGAAVTVYEKSKFPRHKVCGEFLSAEILPLLESLKVKDAFLAASPARLTRAVVHDRNHRKEFRFPEPAYSLSRYALDRILLEESTRRGAILREEKWTAAESAGEPLVLAHGRQQSAPKGGRLFAFKAHFRGPVADIVELHFFSFGGGGGYAGVSPVENGVVNIAGLAPEELLRAHDFHPEPLFSDSLRERMRGLEQSFDWMMTGPLVFHSKFAADAGVYLAGDALGFVDPFTGSGIMAGMLTGRLAGKSAARGVPATAYNQECRKMFGRQYGVSTLLRKSLSGGVGAELMLGVMRMAPLGLLYRLTRPAISPEVGSL